jgi:hypothetical protein
VNVKKKPVRGVMPKSQLARQEEYYEATSGNLVSVSAHVAERLRVGVEAVSAGDTVSMAEARKVVTEAAAARAREKKRNRRP